MSTGRGGDAGEAPTMHAIGCRRQCRSFDSNWQYCRYCSSIVVVTNVGKFRLTKMIRISHIQIDTILFVRRIWRNSSSSIILTFSMTGTTNSGLVLLSPYTLPILPIQRIAMNPITNIHPWLPKYSPIWRWKYRWECLVDWGYTWDCWYLWIIWFGNAGGVTVCSCLNIVVVGSGAGGSCYRDWIWFM